MRITIDTHSGIIVAHDEAGRVVAQRRTYCNPAAMRQIVLDAEMLGGEIDWENSTVAQPDWAMEDAK